MADPPNQRRGSAPYLPPPPETRDDSPVSVEVPRMEPPPSSLEALVRRRPGSSAKADRTAIWAWISLLMAVLSVITVYFVLLRR